MDLILHHYDFSNFAEKARLMLGFKGLERPAVVLAVNGFGVDGRGREKLYVGLSRARDRLVVCGDPELIREVGGEAVYLRLMGG